MISMLYRAMLDILNRTLVGNLRGTLIEFEGLPRGIRVLAVFGYVVVLLLICATLFFELAGDKLSGIAFTISGKQYHIHTGVLVVTSLAFALGWAFVMTGASDFRRRLFFPVVILYVFQLFVFIGAMKGGKPWVTLVMLCFVLDVMLVTIGLHLLTARAQFWRQYPLIEFGGWLGITMFYLALLWGLGESLGAIAAALDGVLSLLILLTLIFWIMLSLDTVDLSIRIARAIVGRLGHCVSDRVLSAVTILLLLARPIIILIIIVASRDGFWLVDWLNSIPLIIVMIVLAVRRRWEKQYVMTLLALSIASPVITLGISLAFKGHDFTELALSSTGIFPPVLLFIALLTYNILTLGTRFANTDGKWMPRTGRVLTYFGVVMLVISFVIFNVNLRLTSTNAPVESLQVGINAFFALSILFLGPFYLVRMVWKHRGKFIDETISTTASVSSPS